MMVMLRHAVAMSWLTLPPVLLAGLIHLTDPDIEGWRGLASPSALWSVGILSALICPLIYLCHRALVDSGWSAFVVATALVALCCSALLTVFGSGAQTAVGHLRTFTGCSAVIVFTVVLAVIPAAAVGWPGTLAGRRGRAASLR